MEGWCLRVNSMCGMIAYTTDKALAFYLYVDRRGHEEFDAANKSVDVDLLILSNHGLTQIQSDAAAESVEPGTVKRFATIDVLVAAVVHRAADTLAVLADRQRSL